MKIKILNDKLINQIAAGEVVDRPAAVVKELVENSIDSGADSIIVETFKGGKSSLRVSDNGCGMSKDDLLLSCERHATSKVENIIDLVQISTRGFRGEALSSISSVSKLTIMSREDSTELGTKLIIHGGVIKSVESTVCNVGTAIEVKNLFYNVPARSKFMRSDSYEATRIHTWLRRSFIGEPNIKLKSFNNGKQIINFTKHKSIIDRARSLVSGNCISFKSELDSTSVEGIVAHPAQAESSLDSLVVLVNKRLISDRLILKAVRDGFHLTLKAKEYPLGVVSILIDPKLVDVNVHPQKSEVRFADPKSVYGLVQSTIYKAVSQFKSPVTFSETFNVSPSKKTFSRRENSSITSNISDVNVSNSIYAPKVSNLSSSRKISNEGSFIANSNIVVDLNVKPISNQKELKVTPEENSVVSGSKHIESEIIYDNLKFITCLFNCYLLFEFLDTKDELLLVDMHAAHERVNYHKFKQEFKNKSIRSNPLFIPIEVVLTPDRIELSRERLKFLNSKGFQFEIVDDLVVFKSLPVLPAKGKSFSKEEITDLVNEILNSEIQPRVLEEEINSLISRKACHASLRSGDVITSTEAYSLISSLKSLPLASACPHGRPVSVRISKSELENWFGRDR